MKVVQRLYFCFHTSILCPFTSSEKAGKCLYAFLFQTEKRAEEERDRQKASLKVFGEAFDEALQKLPLPKHLIKFLSLQSITPMFGSNLAS